MSTHRRQSSRKDVARHWRFFTALPSTIIIGAALGLLVPATSLLWLPLGYEQAPWCFVGIAIIGTILDVLVLSVAFRNLWSASPLLRFPKMGYWPYKKLVEDVPEFSMIVEQSKHAVRDKTLIPGSPAFQSLMEEMRTEIKVFARDYFRVRFKRFVFATCLAIMVCVTAFAGLYLAVCNLEIAFRKCHEAGFSGTFIKLIKSHSSEGVASLVTIGRWVIEAVYASMTTFATLGAAEIMPHSVYARALTGMEALLIVLLLTFWVNFGMVSLQMTFAFSPDEIHDRLRDDLEIETGTGIQL